MKKFELKVAWRHLLTSHGQTELTVGAVAVGVLLVVFLSSLINGLQIGLIEDMVGSIPHVTVEAETPGAKPLWQVSDQGGVRGTVVTDLEKMSTQKRKIRQWERVCETVRGLPDVAGVAPSAEGSGFVSRGAKTVGAMIIGVVPSQQMKVMSLQNRVVEGDFNSVDSQNAAIGVKLADDIGAKLGSRIRLVSDQGIIQTFRVACLFDMGMDQANESWVYTGLSAAQAMFNIGKDVTTLNVRGRGLFSAKSIAEEIRSFSTLKVTSWMESNKAFLDTLRAQNTAAAIIQAMTLMASAFGVASVMIVFVVQKARDIGILKSMGATAKQIQKIFVLEGLGVGIGGAVLGSGIGTGLCFLVMNIPAPGETFGGRPATIVPMNWDIKYVMAASVVAIVVGLMSSLVPAWRASRLDPVEAIRRG
ncbi:MAG: FtsX-like permease family protein [Armatimonadota bacterium]|nr:FtsX-like permease family protein [bacterium]